MIATFHFSQFCKQGRRLTRFALFDQAIGFDLDLSVWRIERLSLFSGVILVWGHGLLCFPYP
jgi:hypothetical protein